MHTPEEGRGGERTLEMDSREETKGKITGAGEKREREDASYGYEKIRRVRGEKAGEGRKPEKINAGSRGEDTNSEERNREGGLVEKRERRRAVSRL